MGLAQVERDNMHAVLCDAFKKLMAGAFNNDGMVSPSDSQVCGRS